ncbi:GNAT family N-acetyltransferase [Methyloglobulus sp.]|uniref:GNAT family N-acetyltransferase n=1 Tax=Methyloglobulus sp. TaxID=2518622 RepID=UPI0039897385
MNISDFRVEPADYQVDFDELRTLREAVFIVEQNIPKEVEFDTVDPDCYHLIARDNQHQAIGTGRLTPDHKIGRMAVLETCRGKGVGEALLLALIDKALKLGWTELMLNAQTTVSGFYGKYGFVKEGDVFMEANISHQIMRLCLEPVSKSSRPVPKPQDSLVEISETKTLEGTLSAILQLIGKARRQICIYSPDLEHVLYGRAEIVEALKQFAINSSGGNVLIIVQDTLAVRSQPHPLLDLAQRLPSAFLFRTPVEADDLQYPSAYIINDRDGYLFRQQSSHYRGVWSPTLPARNRQLAEEFERVWQRCRPCTELRALGL